MARQPQAGSDLVLIQAGGVGSRSGGARKPEKMAMGGFPREGEVDPKEEKKEHDKRRGTYVPQQFAGL